MANKKIGLDKPEEATKVLLDILDSKAVCARRPWFYEVADKSAEEGKITPEQRAALTPYLEMDPPHGMWTPFESAGKDGVISAEFAGELHKLINGTYLHNPCKKCGGTAKYSYAAENVLIEDAELFTDQPDENIVRASDGAVVTLRSCKLKKTGDVSDHMQGNFTGLNAGILAEGGTIVVENSTITTDALGGNGLFSHGSDSRIVLREVLVDAYGAGASRAVYCAYGGTVEAENCEFISRGTISSAVATDMANGTIRLDNCLVKAMGSNCAALYSTGDISAENCMCLAPETEGLIIAGDDILHLKDSYVLSGRSQGVKMNARHEGGDFRMEGGILAVCEGPIVFSCGSGKVYLDDVKIANPSGIAFKANSRGLHMERPDGGEPSELYVELHHQRIEGDSFGDQNHGLVIKLLDGSSYRGAINRDKAATYCSVSIDAASRWELTADCCVSSLDNADPTGANIITNGFRLTVG